MNGYDQNDPQVILLEQMLEKRKQEHNDDLNEFLKRLTKIEIAIKDMRAELKRRRR